MIASFIEVMTIYALALEAACHRVDRYLAQNRGEMLFAADCDSRAAECDRKRITLLINRRTRHGYIA